MKFPNAFHKSPPSPSEEVAKVAKNPKFKIKQKVRLDIEVGDDLEGVIGEIVQNKSEDQPIYKVVCRTYSGYYPETLIKPSRLRD